MSDFTIEISSMIIILKFIKILLLRSLALSVSEYVFPSKLKLNAVCRVCPSMLDAAVPVGATLITHGESVLSPEKKENHENQI